MTVRDKYPCKAPSRGAETAWFLELIDIAAELGLTGETIRRYRRNLAIPGRSTGSNGHVAKKMTSQ